MEKCKPAPAFEYSQLLYWTDHSQSHRMALWEDNGRVVGLCWYDGQIGEALFHLRPGYERIVPDMIARAEERLCRPDGSLTLMIFQGQAAILEVAKRCGYSQVNKHREGISGFSKNSLHYGLPQGYRFQPLAQCDREALQNATWRGFNNEGNSEGGVETVHHLGTAPHRTPELDVVVVDDSGNYVCYAGMWMVPQNRLAYLEPLCTVPEHRGRGIAAAALTELARRTAPLGATHMIGGSNLFYFKIGYEPLITLTEWQKP